MEKRSHFPPMVEDMHSIDMHAYYKGGYVSERTVRLSLAYQKKLARVGLSEETQQSN